MMSTRRLLIATAIACGACAAAQAADFPVNRAVPDARLDTIRGGFDLGSLQASIGLERTVLINGVEAIRQSVNIPDVRNITTAQADALRNVMATTFVSNGPGGVTTNAVAVASQASPSVSAAAAATPAADAAITQAVSLPATLANATLPAGVSPGLVIQNSLDNQTINSTTTINASTNTSQMLQNMRIDESIKDAVIQFRGN
jgi:hypothetical protein